MTVADPRRAASDVAAALDGDLASDDTEALSAIGARRSQTVVSAEDAEELRRLAAELGRAMRVRANTEALVTTTVARKLSKKMGLALHPASVRAAARAVIDAETAVARAGAALTGLGDRPTAIVDTPASDAEETEGEFAEQVSDEPWDGDTLDAAQTRTRAVGLGAALFGLSLVLSAGTPWSDPLVPAWAAAVGLALGLLLALLIVRRGRRRRAAAAQRREPARVLVAAAATNPQAEDDSGEARDAWKAERAWLEIAFEQAEGDRRAARRAWHALVGPGADPHDADEQVRLRDPQVDISADDLAASPAIRTVRAFQRKAAARWRVSWAALGIDDPPEPDRVDQALAALTVHRPLVLVEPSAEVEAAIQTLPPSTEVVIVTPARG